MKKSKSSGKWLKEHASDQYVKAAKAAKYRSRAVYKLLEIQNKYQIIKPGMTVVDLGAAPGAWCQVVSEWVGASGNVFGGQGRGAPGRVRARLEGVH